MNRLSTIRVTRENLLRLKRLHQELLEAGEFKGRSSLNEVLALVLERAGVK